MHYRTNHPRVVLSSAKSYAAFCKVVGGELDSDFVTSEDANIVLTHPSGDMGCDDMPILELYSEHGIGKGFNDRSLHFNMVFFGHAAY